MKTKIILTQLLLLQCTIFYSQNFPIVGFGDEANYVIGRYDVPGSSGLNLHWYGGIRFGDSTSNSVMQITNGNVGIGTATPSAKLDVNLALPHEGKFSSQKWSTRNDDYNLTLQTIWNNNGINQQFIQRYNGIDYTSLSFYTGNVGIGLSNPDEKLTVNGKIHTKEVRVDLTAPMTVPDYVFANNYKLKTLPEVETYIKANSHLPEIPSAAAIEKNGLMLAEMNMSLLKKIEELTLYAIQQEKKLEAQNKAMEVQIKQIDLLSDRLSKLEKK